MLNVWLLSVVALYFWVLMILKPLSRIRRPTRPLSADCFAIACQAMGDQHSLLILAILRSCVAARNSLGLSGAAHGYEPRSPYRPAGPSRVCKHALLGSGWLIGRKRHARNPRDVTCITLHRSSTGHSSFQASMNANLIDFGLQRNLSGSCCA